MSTIHPTLRPAGLDEYVGQPNMKDRIAVAIAAAKATGRRFPHCLFFGPHGSGKSTIAYLIAEALGDELVEVIKPPTNSRMFLTQLEQLGAGILFIDEAHLWPPKLATSTLYTLMEAGAYDTGYGMVPFPDISVVCATTERRMLSKALRSRFAITPAWEDYTVDEMTEIAALFATKIDLALEESTLRSIAEASAGSPRTARNLVEMAFELNATSETPTVGRILSLSGVEADGLTVDHIRYLRAVADNGGRAGINGIAARMRLDTRTVSEIEELLLDRGMLIHELSGRYLTPVGWQRVSPAKQRKSRRLDRVAS